MRVGVIGCGAIGSVVAGALVDGDIEGAVLSGVMVRTDVPAHIGHGVGIDELISRSDLIVEAAGQDALRSLGPRVLSAGVDLVCVSIGALADAELFAEMQAAGPGRLHLASGAIGGVDMVRSVAALGPIDDAQIVTTKRPTSLDQPWMSDDERARIVALDHPETLFEGDVRELVRLFPSSTNVAATLALAVGSWDVVGGTVRADPAADLTSHVIEVRGAAGEYRFEMRHHPSPSNPRSSAVVPWAVIRTLRDLCGRSWRFA